MARNTELSDTQILLRLCFSYYMKQRQLLELIHKEHGGKFKDCQYRECLDAKEIIGEA